MPIAEKGQVKVCTVWLESEISEGKDRVKIFRCFNCGMIVTQYWGDVITLVPGRTPYTPGTSQKCKGNVRLDNGTWEECGMYYCFQGTVYTKNPHMT